MMKGQKYENSQTANLNKVMKSGAVVREILWEIEKSVAKTKSDEVSAVSTNSRVFLKFSAMGLLQDISNNFYS